MSITGLPASYRRDRSRKQLVARKEIDLHCQKFSATGPALSPDYALPGHELSPAIAPTPPASTSAADAESFAACNRKRNL